MKLVISVGIAVLQRFLAGYGTMFCPSVVCRTVGLSSVCDVYIVAY